MPFNPYKSGEWALYKGEIVRVLWIDHKAPYRVCIEFTDKEDYLIGNDYVHNSTLTPLDSAVSSILSSLNTTNHNER